MLKNNSFLNIWEKLVTPSLREMEKYTLSVML